MTKVLIRPLNRKGNNSPAVKGALANMDRVDYDAMRAALVEHMNSEVLHLPQMASIMGVSYQKLWRFLTFQTGTVSTDVALAIGELVGVDPREWLR